MVLSPLSSSPLGPLSLIGVPTGIWLLAFRHRRPIAVLAGLGWLGLAAVGVGAPSALWFVERGWAVLVGGGFAVAGALAPGRSVFARSLMAVGGASAAVAVLTALRPDLMASLDWSVAGHFDAALASFDLEGGVGATMAEALRQVREVVRVLYPGLLVLASLAALGCATYVVGRLEGDDAPLGPLRAFRFHDHLVWILVLGLALLVASVGDWSTRVGANVALAMAGLYVLRGIAVLAWLGTSVVSSRWSIALWVLAALVFYPITVGTALVMGLSDTWLDLRSRLRVEGDRG